MVCSEGTGFPKRLFIPLHYRYGPWGIGFSLLVVIISGADLDIPHEVYGQHGKTENKVRYASFAQSTNLVANYWWNICFPNGR